MEPTRAEVDAMAGATILEFGATWCGYCQGARPVIDGALAKYPDVRHIWVEDGQGKRLGRSFGIKLWPTLVLVKDGQEVARVVRPQRPADVEAVLARVG